jgi:DnaJ-class molecular chaperone
MSFPERDPRTYGPDWPPKPKPGVKDPCPGCDGSGIAWTDVYLVVTCKLCGGTGERVKKET